ncbi:hypothetical protein ASE80_26785 [Pseudomonas sp. Leaf15]|nr:hypothetical protein ASE80_26785 [Pseudomonas sp. Leaf15]
MVKGEAVVVRQAQVFKLAAGIVAIAQSAPALVFGGEAVLWVVFVGQRPVAVVDAEEIALAVVGILDNIAVWQGFSYEAAGVVSLVAGNELTAVVAVFGFLRQVAVEVIHVSRALAVKTDFLLDQAVGVVIEPVGFACLVFDRGQQQARIVVAPAGSGRWGGNRAGRFRLPRFRSRSAAGADCRSGT